MKSLNVHQPLVRVAKEKQKCRELTWTQEHTTPTYIQGIFTSFVQTALPHYNNIQKNMERDDKLKTPVSQM